MFYELIAAKRDQWFEQSDCPVKDMIAYIEKKGYMRDAQIGAIKTYLFLKIAHENKPLWQLFVEGRFNSLNIDDLELNVTARAFMGVNPAAAALMEYARLRDKNGKQLSPELESFIKTNANKIDYESAFSAIFYNARYSDYIYSLPMGAGKTYLMAAFIYLDLHFAQNEPNNKAFAHNFIIFAPSGLKSSIVPSLKTIERFDPSWIIAEPAASELKKLIKFEILDEPRSQNKNNRAKNPNAQKINSYQPLNDLIGLIAIVNAEKVILDRIDALGVHNDSPEDERDKQANELRNIIGKIPNLAIYIDEVHHAADDDIKLRKVVTQWTKKSGFNSVIGFSGTPYLEKAESATIAERFVIKNTELTNVAYYYPLIDGINNFLKTPRVKRSSNEDSLSIVENGIRDFLDQYKETIYGNQTTAKLAIYCGTIENLEETIYPKAAQIVEEYGLNPAEVILKYHRGNKNYNVTKEAQTEFASLDLPISKKRIILLVQIGKEGWDCRSLSGVILSQKGDCPTNMVLQTACRCLRQVDKNKTETALIWLNKFNEETLNKQLKSQQNTDLNAFETAANKKYIKIINRYSRIDHLRLPPIDFYQLRVKYDTIVIEKAENPKEAIAKSVKGERRESIIETKILGDDRAIDIAIDKEFGDEFADFNRWLYLIAKESFGFITMNALNPYLDTLRAVYNEIVYTKDGRALYSAKYDQGLIRSNIRKAFYDKRDVTTKDEIVPQEARLLKIEKLFSPIETTDVSKYRPDQSIAEKIRKLDDNEIDPLNKKVLKMIEDLEAMGQKVAANALRETNKDIDERHYTYHYLSYFFASALESDFFDKALTIVRNRGLEIYYNGDRELTEFKIACHKQTKKGWQYIGEYTPDFLIIKRKDDKIYKVIIVETKGAIYADKFKDKLDFMRTAFKRKNNEKFKYDRFDFLYLEDSEPIDQRIIKTINAIENF
ncbi:MAG: DEAD/DEAH box helicase family protein [Helicobacteraceae bacterium]|jgi:superfamily II DNA or RNA helicase|nr:DEAD/DEAH box helicase family protein [Helicobacteraceae bacterium]